MFLGFLTSKTTNTSSMRNFLFFANEKVINSLFYFNYNLLIKYINLLKVNISRLSCY